MSLPIVETQRLILRPLRAGDEPAFLALASEREVARMTSDIPHPLLPSHARAWLRPNARDVRFAVELHGRMIGSVGYFERRSGAAELGFWLGRDHWGFGFASEAGAAVVRYGFSEGRQGAFSSAYFVDNPASGRVLAKLGFESVGRAPMWCAARGEMVEAVGLWLTRARAEAVLGPLGESVAEERARPTRLGRWITQARRALREHARF